MMYPTNDMQPVQCMLYWHMPNAELAQAYVPFQQLTYLYPPVKGLERGTIFPELDMPYRMGSECTADAWTEVRGNGPEL